MEPLAALLAAGVAGSIAYLIAWATGRRRFQAWERAAKAAGLESLVPSSVAGVDTRLTGASGPVTVRLESYHRGRSEHGTRITIAGLAHGPYDLTLRGEGITSAIEKRFGESEVEVGDPAFDSRVYMQGSPALIRALFDAPTRELVGGLMQGSLGQAGAEWERPIPVRALLSGGEIRVDIREGWPRGVREIPPWTAAALVEIGRRLARPADLARRIADNTRTEALGAVRAGNLRTLAREFGAHPATREALLASLGDPDADVRLLAASALGAEGRETLLDLATSDEVADETAARAIEAVGADFPAALALDLLDRAVAAGRLSVAGRCVAVLGTSGGEAAVGALARLVGGADEALAEACAAALGRVAGRSGEASQAPGEAREERVPGEARAERVPGEAREERVPGGVEAAERALVAALASESARLRVAAATALGEAGSPLSVVPLGEAAAAHPLDGVLRKAAREAVAAIQSRRVGASPGQLSLVPGGGGELSLAEEESRGRLSIDERRTAVTGPQTPVNAKGRGATRAAPLESTANRN